MSGRGPSQAIERRRGNGVGGGTTEVIPRGFSSGTIFLNPIHQIVPVTPPLGGSSFRPSLLLLLFFVTSHTLFV